MAVKLKSTNLILLVFLLFASLERICSGSRDSAMTFSPSGDLLQVEGADMAGMLGNPLIACVSEVDQSIVLCTKPLPLQSLMDSRSIDKVSKVDSNIWIAFSGLAGDGRSLVRLARQFCSSFRMEFGCAPPVIAVARELGDIQHKCTMGSKERPYGVHCLILGFDDIANDESKTINEDEGDDMGDEARKVEREQSSLSPKIFLTKPSGQVTRWRGVAIGRNCYKTQEQLEEEIQNHLKGIKGKAKDGIGRDDSLWLRGRQLSEESLASISMRILKKEVERSDRGDSPSVVGTNVQKEGGEDRDRGRSTSTDIGDEAGTSKSSLDSSSPDDVSIDVYRLKRPSKAHRFLEANQNQGDVQLQRVLTSSSPVLQYFASVKSPESLKEKFLEEDRKSN